ncbi:MAG: hypothetical protein L0196_11420 [candidate division Zixibacteria bacterium]|nr:hypothetical protein [candidate division Zixibacteria bacterium]
MTAHLKKFWLPLSVFLFAVCWLPHFSAFPLPKDQKPPVPGSTGSPGEVQQPATTRPLPANPVRYGPDRNPVPNPSLPLLLPGDADEPEYRSLAPNRIGATTVPFIDVQTGTVEFPYTNNYMREHSVHLVGGNAQVHMVYPIFTGNNTSPWTGTAADSLQSRIPLFYNSYNCGGSGMLDHPPPGIRLSDTTGDGYISDLMWGGGVLNFASPTQTTIVYGNRLIQRTDLGAYIWSFRGTGTIRDSAECAGRFSMIPPDTLMNGNYTIPNTDPVARAINESVWVATYDGEDPNKVYFNYTTDRGLTWTTPIVSPMSTSWWNAVEIASDGGDVFYLTGMSNPANPSTFWLTERPCYVKGTYNPVSGSITLGPMTDITGDFSLPAYLPIPHQLQGVLVGTILHVIWTDWNNYNGNGFPGVGGRVWHASVAVDGSVSGPHKIANINIDGRLPDRSGTLFGFAQGPWGAGLGLSYNSANNALYAIWSQPREQYDINGAPTYQWDDPWAGLLANFDIYYAVSNNGGIAWDIPFNLTDTKNPGCAGTAASPCIHEDYFAAYPEVVNDTIWILSITRPKPGFREVVWPTGQTPDPGSWQIMLNKIRLYKAPARPLQCDARADLFVRAPDTTNMSSIVIPPRGSHTVNLRFGNISCNPAGVFLDSLVVDPSLNEGAGPGLLQVTHTLNPGQFVPLGGFYDFTLTFDASEVGVLDAGTRSGLIKLYVHTDDPSVPPPNNQAVVLVAASVNIVPSYCLNQQIRIHSATNVTDIGTQGSIADEAGTAGLMYYPGASDASNRFYDGGVWIANSELDAGLCESNPRRITRQIFGDDFLRCIADGELDSVPTTGGYNLWMRSVATDVGDSSLIWLNLWEQSTHPDSSDWLVQNVRAINASENSIDSVALGALYDIDVFSNISQPARNVGGDTIILGADSRSYHLGWIAGNDVLVDTCTPNSQLYGFIVIPDPLSAPPLGDTVEPRLAVVHRGTAFAYNLDCNASGGDSLAQRWSWNVTGFHSPTNRIRDPNRGDDSLIYDLNTSHAFADTCSDGRLWRADMDYMTIAKKVYNFPTNLGAREAVARYGLGSLAASVDTFFRGSGESYSVIHIGSITGLSGLINSARKAVAWFWNHAGQHVGTTGSQTGLRGDLNDDRNLSGADIVAELGYIFNGMDNPFGSLIPKCVADVNGDGNLSGADIVTVINGTFNAPGGVNPSPACPLCLTSCQ